MAYCKFCGEYPYKTRCAGFIAHLENCMEKKKMKDEIECLKIRLEEEKEREHTPINITNIQVNMYTDYPKTPSNERWIKYADEFDVKEIKSLNHLADIIEMIQNSNGGVINKDLEYGSPVKTSQAYSFIADIMRRLREKMQKIALMPSVVIEEATRFEYECMAEKQKFLTM